MTEGIKIYNLKPADATNFTQLSLLQADDYISRESKTTRNVLWSRASVCMCVCVCVCLSVCLSAAACLQYCTDPDVTWGSGRGCPLVVHYWANLQSVLWQHYGNAWQSQAVIRQAQHTPHAAAIKSTRLLRVRRYLQRGRSISSILRPGVATRTRNVSEYMLALALCLVNVRGRMVEDEPSGPVGPVAPRAPRTPARPGSPRKPCGPLGPVAPVPPLAPVWPVCPV